MLLWVFATVSRRESSSMGGDHSEERSERGWELVSRSQSTSHPQGGPKGVLAASQSVSTGLNLDIPCPSFPKHPMGFIHAYSMLIPVHLSCSLFSLFEKAVADSDHGFAMKITKGHAVPYHVRMWPSRATPMCDQVGRSKSMPAMACIRNLTGHGPKSSEILQLSWSNIFLVKHRDKCNFYWNLQGAGAWNHLKRSLKPHLTPRRQVAPWPWTRP